MTSKVIFPSGTIGFLAINQFHGHQISVDAALDKTSKQVCIYITLCLNFYDKFYSEPKY